VERAEAAPNQALQQIAYSLGRKKLFKINHLNDCESAMTGASGRQALSRGLVEFSARMNTGFAHG
jgi:hypothetical protein